MLKFLFLMFLFVNTLACSSSSFTGSKNSSPTTDQNINNTNQDNIIKTINSGQTDNPILDQDNNPNTETDNNTDTGRTTGNNEPPEDVLFVDETPDLSEREYCSLSPIVYPNANDPVTNSWVEFDFQLDPSFPYLGDCNGKKYIHFHSRYERYVGVISCDKPGRYKIFLGNSPSDPFFQIGDNSGHGQDHCELVNPNFRITADDDITSACPECDIKTIQVGSLDLENIKGYYRQGFGDDFLCYRNTGRIAFWWDAVNWYECGIELP